MTINTLTAQIQTKTQLNLKKDETIIDVAYCVQSNQKNHCLWLLDEKLQVWKCSNELNATSINYSLTKITMFEPSEFRRFFKPATTYDSYSDTSVLNNIKAFRGIDTKQCHQ